MKKIFSRSATWWLIIAIVVSIVLVIIFLSFKFQHRDWFPQALLTLVGLTGASWFVGYRLDILAEGVNVQRAAVESSERANFTGAIKDAVGMMSATKLSTSIAGQLWLHSLAAESNLREAPRLVQSLLSAHVTNTHIEELESRQLALNLLFNPDEERYDSVAERANLSRTTWTDFDFLNLNLRGANVRKGDFTSVETVEGACFNNCDLSETKWHLVGGGGARTQMRSARLHGAESFTDAVFENVDFTGAILSRYIELSTHFRYTSFIDCEFRDSEWNRAIFTSCFFTRCNFYSAILHGVILERPVFEDCRGISVKQFGQIGKMRNPKGLPQDVEIELKNRGVIEYPDF